MNIIYKIGDESFSFVQDSPKHKEMLSTLLTNSKGDYLNLGLKKNFCKFQGLSIANKDNMDIFKILDEIVLDKDLEIQNVEISESKITKSFKPVVQSNSHILVDGKSNSDHLFGSEGKLEYNNLGQLEENVEQKVKVRPVEDFFLGPTGGFVYNLNNYSGNLFFDLDSHKINDFDEWGRNYKVYKKDNIVIVEYTKKKDEIDEYKLYFAIYAQNFDYNIIDDWVKKEYWYSKERNSGYERYAYRFIDVKIDQNIKLVCGAGFSEKEVIEQIKLLQAHEDELDGFEKALYRDVVPNTNFNQPLSQNIDAAYRLSSISMYKFMNKDLVSHVKNGCFAGLPWFSQVWSRDDLIATRGFIELNDDNLVREKLFSYFNLIDEETGLLPILSTPGSFSSPDSTFWLAKRFEDFIYSLDERGELDKILSEGDIKIVYEKLLLSFNRIIKNNWDSEKELIKVKYGDSWMDTINLIYPLDVQVQFLSFVSTLSDLAVILNRDEDTKRFLDLEDSLRHKIRSAYRRGGKLYNEILNDDVNSNVFLAYYVYPNLFLKEDWEVIFDLTLREIRLNWGGVASLSKKHKDFQENYTGENNISYHRGDSWFWINNLAAITMHDLNEKKYRNNINKIIQASTNDILKMGTLGYGSEISSAKLQKAQGSQAQLWSSSTYIELIHKVFSKSN